MHSIFFKCIFILIISGSVLTAQLNYNTIDDFNRSDNNNLGSPWLETEDTGHPEQISVSSNTLLMQTGGVSNPEPTNASVNLTNFVTGFDLGNGVSGWSFHLDLNRNPSGWGTASYSAGWVILANENDFSTGTVDGYAVIWTGSNDELVLVQFNDGISGTDPGNVVIATGLDWDNISTDGINIRIEVTENGVWRFYWEEGAPIANATDIDAFLITSVDSVTVLFDDENLMYSGPVWAHNTATTSTSTADFDNFNFATGEMPDNTTIQFTSAAEIANEENGTFNLLLSISNPDSLTTSSADVVLISGDASDLENYATQQVSFPAGSSENQVITIHITDDAELEGDEQFTFELQNLSGGNSISAGTPAQFTLTVKDNDLPPVMITEIMQNPSDVSDASGEWFELYNAGVSPVNIDGWHITDNGSDLHVIDNGGNLLIPAGGFVVCAANSDSGTNGGLIAQYEYNGITLGNGADDILLYLSDGVTEVDRVQYDGGAEWPDPTGASMQFTARSDADNNNPVFWSTATSRQPFYQLNGNSDMGSPGTNGADQSLPVKLTSFTAQAGDGKVILKWITESEVDNLGFVLRRSETGQDEYEVIASYETDESMKGAGNTNEKKNYRFEDKQVFNGIAYYYRLSDVDFNGVETAHGTVYAAPNASSSEIEKENKSDLPSSFRLKSNYPNPFNPQTTISFDIPYIPEEFIPVRLTVYDILGQKIKTLFDGKLSPGSYSIDWDGKNQSDEIVSSGIYLYTLVSPHYISSNKMMLLR